MRPEVALMVTSLIDQEREYLDWIAAPPGGLRRQPLSQAERRLPQAPSRDLQIYQHRPVDELHHPHLRENLLGLPA